MIHFKLNKYIGICGSVDIKNKNLTANIDKVTCPDCIKLEKHFKGNYKKVLCYSRNDLINSNIL